MLPPSMSFPGYLQSHILTLSVDMEERRVMLPVSETSHDPVGEAKTSDDNIGKLKSSEADDCVTTVPCSPPPDGAEPGLDSPQGSFHCSVQPEPFTHLFMGPAGARTVRSRPSMQPLTAPTAEYSDSSTKPNSRQRQRGSHYPNLRKAVELGYRTSDCVAAQYILTAHPRLPPRAAGGLRHRDSAWTVSDAAQYRCVWWEYCGGCWEVVEYPMLLCGCDVLGPGLG
ncbi:hypothetical protein MJT46_009574 [Ovis ammon polii x Ovis aries]|nr:hypothetical protein MJT46_009574 [Ovis ammon polii x Ovis aries]